MMSCDDGAGCRASNFAAILPMFLQFSNHYYCWTIHYCEKHMRHFRFIYLKDWSISDYGHSDVTCPLRRILDLD